MFCEANLALGTCLLFNFAAVGKLSFATKYSLYTFLGERVFDLIFYDVFQEGSFILFENEEGKLFVTTSDKLDEDILNLSPKANFIYDDYEYFDDNNILLFSEEKEELLNSEMNYIISFFYEVKVGIIIIYCP